jgi:hypothetical protein
MLHTILMELIKLYIILLQDLKHAEISNEEYFFL